MNFDILTHAKMLASTEDWTQDLWFTRPAL